MANPFKGPVQSQKKSLYFFVPAHTRQLILVSYEAPFRQKPLVQMGSWPQLDQWSSKGNGPTGEVFFCKVLLNRASHYTKKIGCIPLVWAGTKKFSFLLWAGPLSPAHNHQKVNPTALISAYKHHQVDSAALRRGSLEVPIGYTSSLMHSFSPYKSPSSAIDKKGNTSLTKTIMGKLT